MKQWIFTPIATARTARTFRYDVPRQGALDPTHIAEIVFEHGRNFEQAIDDLRGFDRIWLLSVFHLNEGWKTRVSVPRHRTDTVGVFATRAPYRPNPIGLSCVRLLAVTGRTLRVGECDLIDGTPILDVKPYLPYADSFPDAATGWVPRDVSLFTVTCTDAAAERLDWLCARGVNILPFARTQLEYEPRSAHRKRLWRTTREDEHILAYRTWRVRFRIDEKENRVLIVDIFSGYTAEDLTAPADPYGDKELHRAFLAATGTAASLSGDGSVFSGMPVTNVRPPWHE